jgi:hypothetical protein
MRYTSTKTVHMKVRGWVHGGTCSEAGFHHREGLNPAERRVGGWVGGLEAGGCRRLGGFMVTKKEGKARVDVGLMHGESYRKKEVGC